jgi:thiol:disulfide interchange protein DsbG
MKRPILTMAVVWLLAGAASTLLTAWGPLAGDTASPGVEVPDRAWKALEASAWIADGRADAPRVVYAFTDPNCPYCNRFWHDARPWVDAGKVQVRHVLVGILGPTSAAKAAALLSARDPAAALLQHERERGKSGGVKPADAIDPAVQKKLDANYALMQGLGSSATPTILFRDAAGKIREVRGAPRGEALAAVLGPR